MSRGHEEKYAALLATMEKSFNCAGVCELPSFYLFSNVKPPTLLCKDVIISKIREYTYTYAGFSFTASGVGLVGLCLSFAIGYHKKNELKYSWQKYQHLKLR